MTISAPTRDIGSLDNTLFGGLYSDYLELIPDLQWPLTVQTYARMRHDPQLTAVMAAYTLPIRRATWAVDPAGCRDEVVQMVADDLGLPILGTDAQPGPARRRGVSWSEHLRHALLSLVFGHMPFERRYEIRADQARLVNLGERMPHTIGAIDLNRDGTLKSISQDTVGSRPIPADRLCWYVHDREGANWTGRSLLRPAYGAWLLKHETWRVHATSIRRFGMGVPSVEAPAGATPAQVAEAQRLASAMRAGDQSGVGLPPGFKLAVTGMTGSVPDALAFISYLDQQMSRMALAGMLDLGQTPNGSRALGDSFLDLFLLSLQSIADQIADTATTGTSVDIVDLNWGEDEPAPRIVAADVGTRHEVNAQALQGLISSGAITPDPELEAYVRKAWRLPASAVDAPPAPQPAPQPAPAPTPAPVAARKRRTARARQARAAGPEGGWRQLTLTEAASGMNPDAIHALWQTALDKLLAAWDAISKAWRDALAKLIRSAVDGGDLAALASMQLDPAEAENLLTETMVSVATLAAAQMVAEAASQGVTIDVPAVDDAQLAAVAETVAGLMAGSLASTGGREALRIAVSGATGEDVAAAVTAHLEGLGDTFLKDQLGGALSTAQASGRFAVLDVAPDAQYSASEVLDAGTCQKCLDEDGHMFASLAEAKLAYANGGYIDCLGGLRCRGIIVAVWNEGA